MQQMWPATKCNLTYYGQSVESFLSKTKNTAQNSVLYNEHDTNSTQCRTRSDFRFRKSERKVENRQHLYCVQMKAGPVQRLNSMYH